MLRVLGNRSAACDGLTRREAIRVGGLSLFGGVTLATLLKTAQALKANPSWLAEEPISVQQGLWPALVPKSEPPEQIVLEQLRATPKAIRIAAARDAVVA